VVRSVRSEAKVLLFDVTASGQNGTKTSSAVKKPRQRTLAVHYRNGHNSSLYSPLPALLNLSIHVPTGTNRLIEERQRQLRSGIIGDASKGEEFRQVLIHCFFFSHRQTPPTTNVQ
jgi:hypothetical protein